MTEFTKIAGVETPIEVAKLINALVDEKGNIDLDNLSATGEAKFTNLATKINTVQENVNTLTTTVNEKIGATVSKAQNGYIKFTNGVILQWGYYNGAKSSTDVQSATVTFPIAFSRSYIIIANAKEAGDVVNIYSLTNTTFDYWLADRLLNVKGVNNFYWLSIGI